MEILDYTESIQSISLKMANIESPIAQECLLDTINLCESLHAERDSLKKENQSLKDQINKLKGEQGVPLFKSKESINKDGSTENERKKAESLNDNGPMNGYKLDKPAIEKLIEREIPETVLSKLKQLDKYDDENKFLDDVKLAIGEDDFNRYREKILKYATYRKRCRASKVDKIVITNEVFCPVNKNELPEDAYRISDSEKVVQDIVIKPDNTLFKKEVYYSPSEGKTYAGDCGDAYRGEYGPNVISQIFTLKFHCGMSEPRVLRYLLDSGVIISSSHISNVLIHSEEIDIFIKEREDILEAGLRHCKYQQIDDTGCSVNGKSKYVQIICHPIYAVFITTDRKDRLTILDLFRLNRERIYIFNEEAFELLKQMNVSKSIIEKLRKLTNNNVISDKEMDGILDQLFIEESKGKNTRVRIKEAGAISYYHQEVGVPTIEVLVSDDAPQFKLLTERLALCWVHDARHYKKLSPISLQNKKLLDDFSTRYWDYYRKLLKYKIMPSEKQATDLRTEFKDIFSTITSYDLLDERIALTMAKSTELLTVLDFPEIPLHNNLSENGARLEKRYQDISFYTKNEAGTLAKDTMLSVIETCRRLGVNAREYILDRVSRKFAMPSLASLIKERGGKIIDSH